MIRARAMRPAQFGAALWVALCFGATAQTAAPPPALSARLAQAEADCAALGGALSGQAAALIQTDLTGDGQGWVLDSARLRCSAAASLFCGTGGCELAFAVGDHVTTRLAKGWQITDMPPLRVLLLQVHGSRCGGTNLRPCLEALTWDPTSHSFTSLSPEAP